MITYSNIKLLKVIWWQLITLHLSLLLINYINSQPKFLKTMNNRPLSPHLTINRPQLNSVLSILHRITGVALIISLLMVIGFFISLIFGEETFKVFSIFFNSIIGKIIMFFSLCGIWYHFFAGLRHLFWDMGYGFNLKWVEYSSYSILGLTFFFILASLLV